VSNLCVNSCLYCGFRKENPFEKRRRLTIEEVKKETEELVKTGHKRLIVVYGEHSLSDIDYIADTIRAIYETKVDNGEVRRVNINAAPQSIENQRILKEVGIGTFQVFQETYHHETYRKMHPKGIKSNYQWRLYALHRAQEAGVDDVAIGALFGLYDWKFEVMGLLYHAIDLEKRGPHTISFPRLEPAENAPITRNSPYLVNDQDFKRLVTVIRLSVPYTGMILTAREPAHIRREVINVGCTQTDASTRIGIGAYSEAYEQQDRHRRLQRSIRAAVRPAAVHAGRHPEPGRSHKGAGKDGIPYLVLHRGIPLRPHGKLLHEHRQKRQGPPVLHTQRHPDLQGVPSGLRIRTDQRHR